MSKNYEGRCFCGSVEFVVSGEPAAMGYCHCESCRTCVYAALIPDLPYRPGVHVNYQETKLRMKDGLPKMKDLPKEMGGSGEVVAE
jgi:hypothetical protein